MSIIINRFCVLTLLFALACSNGNPKPDEISKGETKRTAPTWYENLFFGKELAYPEKPKDSQLSWVDTHLTEEKIERGKYLVNHIAACGMCHSAEPGVIDSPLSGGRLLRDSFGDVYAANITPDKETGIGNWQVTEVVEALRAAKGKGGRELSLDMHAPFRWISDADVSAIAAYILSQPGVKNGVPKRSLGLFEKKRFGLISRHQGYVGYVPSLPANASARYGRYLSHHVAGCRDCHSPVGGSAEDETMFSGVEPEEEGLVTSVLSYFNNRDVKTDSDSAEYNPERNIVGQKGPDIRGKSDNGLLSWSEDNIVSYLLNGINPSGVQSNGSLCPWPYYKGMTLRDKQAIARYLMTL